MPPTQELGQSCREELRQFDLFVLRQMDEKVREQQSLLQQAGVPGFWVTSSAEELHVQRMILNLILGLPGGSGSLQDRLEVTHSPSCHVSVH